MDYSIPSLASVLAETPIGAAIGYRLQTKADKIKQEVDAALYCATCLSYVSASRQRRYLSPTGCSLNLFSVLAVVSGGGKGLYFQTLTDLQTEFLAATRMGKPGSDAGLKAAFARHGSLLWAVDEWSGWLSAVTSKDDVHAHAVFSSMLALWSTPASLPMTELAPNKDKKKAGDDISEALKDVRDPRMSLFATATPGALSPALQHQSVWSTGLVSRLLVWTPSGPVSWRFRAGAFPVNDWAQTLHQSSEMTWTPRAAVAIDNIKEVEKIRLTELKSHETDYHAYARYTEQAIRLSSLIALSQSRTEISHEDVGYARELVRHSQAGLGSVVDDREIRPSSFQDKVMRVQEALEWIEARGQLDANLVYLFAPWLMEESDKDLNRYLRILESSQRIQLDHKNKTKFVPGDLWGVAMKHQIAALMAPVHAK